MNATTHPQTACLHDEWVVNFQSNNRTASSACSANDSRTIVTPVEMERPAVLSRIE